MAQFNPQEIVTRAELIGALTFALDLTEGQPAGHCIRSCWIGYHVGMELGLSARELDDLYFVLLLKDLGCSSTAARVCQLYVTDDISFKRDMRALDGSMRQVLGFLFTHTGPNQDFANRMRTLIKACRDTGKIANELVETRCQAGANIARQLGFNEEVAAGIAALDEHWDGTGLPDRLAGKDIPMTARIALLAQVVDVFSHGGRREAALKEVQNRHGKWFDPAVSAAFVSASEKQDFWTVLEGEDVDQAVFDLPPGRHSEIVSEDYLDQVSAAFAKVIDAKSAHTAGHSERVTVFTDLIASEMNYSAEQRRVMKRAALLHDIGKLGISNSILDKPAALTDEEYAEIKRHPTYSGMILSRISAFANTVAVAEGHHERLDGKGYPKKLQGDEISPETRIVTVADVFDALTADRPYREGMSVEKSLSILDEGVGSAFDAHCVEALKRALQKLDAQTA